ncbi:MAG: T9SS C-terminal target domain-containing protein [Candidatus Zixiibacteriota bacterium]|nr:MAG: T9SS C-terminal target domain-containing protein [candidate division Zixibacteria bacterium]
MRLRIAVSFLLLALTLAGAVHAAGYVWGPGDVPEITDENFGLYEARRPVGMTMDETDDSTGYDARYYNVEIKFPTTSPYNITGKVDMHFTVDAGPLNYLNLNFQNNMVVDSVKVNGVSTVSQFLGSDGLRVTLPAPLPTGANAVASIWYHGVPLPPSPPLYSGLDWDNHLGTVIIYSLSEAEAARTWWPCKDVPFDKADSVRMVWTVPSNFVATGNGLLRSVTTPQAGWKAYEWVETYPISTYLVVINATNYKFFRNWYVNAALDSLPLDYYVYPEDSADAVIDFAFLPTVVAYFASIYGEYPFMNEKYGHSAFPWGGGMEHQTNTSIGASLINPSGTYHWLYVHELAHMWWGDMVTCETWADIWLNEGFATYSDAQWHGFSSGQTSFNNRMNSFKSTYLSSLSSPSQGVFPIYNPTYMWGGTVYQKGAWILHMIRYVMGDTVFYNNFWPQYRQRFAFDCVTTAELQQTIEDVTGDDWDWFFNQWVYLAGHPKYQWAYQTQVQGANTVVNVYIKQNQTLSAIWPVFNMPVELKIVQPTGTQTVVAHDSLGIQYFSFTVPGTVSSVQFDPNNWILKEISTVAWVPPIWSLDLSPTGAPIQIPASGGSFAFDVTMHNQSSTAQTVNAWIMQQQPNGTWQGPMLGPLTLTIFAGANITRSRNQNVPSTAAPGTYLYEGRLGTYPNFIIAADNFTYTKLTTGDGAAVADWANWGESFDAWLAEPEAVPVDYVLAPAHPNPFNPVTALGFRLPATGYVSVRVYDTAGREIRTLVEGWREAGSHEVTFDASGLPSGIYFARLSAGGKTQVQKLILLK